MSEIDKRQIPVLYLVVPCYNEEEVVEKSAGVMGDKIRRLIQEGKIAPGSKIMFVNDGSKDKTLYLLHRIAEQDRMFSVVSLAGNYGHQSAILAGMMTARQYADAVVTIDADLQQDIEALDQFIARYMDGCEVVYGVRNDRHSDGIFKKATATAYYKLMHMLGSTVMTNHADYRLMSKKALNALAAQRGQTLAQMALRWVLDDTQITSVLIGASRPEQILENINILGHGGFTAKEREEIDRIVI